ncbi:PEP-CTERM sorting domain-containing protein [Desulfomicrobium sp. ZS1]|jgi:hypothetical protein|uniref:PEP-CTERM sorting domain-containing protein n=1 Tax=Desulfomicrobium sp. ZS1 TaxID=2952228 RepID=UPI0020B2F1F7|nr:PEP-CTERM sorting domain-containing protein [Desulfomicrobium sp. ZS1]UTF51720.1 PEP-CTERM sorting domain-containing protein [Desulfomicrobium sp. ZS1]
MLKFTFSKIAILILALFVISNNVFAETIVFNETDFLVSTVSTSSLNLSSDPALAPMLPADGTFTLFPDSDNLYLASNVGKYLRFDFTLPSIYSSFDFVFDASVNDEYALYINDTVVAMQASTDAANFDDPLPGFHLDATGTAVDTSGKLEYLLSSGMQSLFHSGLNELTLFGTDTLLYGGFNSINGGISYDTTEPPPNPVPEPSTIMLVGISLVGLAGVRRKFRN